MTNWTKTLPAENGWYWWRGLKGDASYLFSVIQHPNGIKIWTGGEWASPEDGYWWPERVEPPPETVLDRPASSEEK